MTPTTLRAEQAIARGSWLVNIPAIFIFIGAIWLIVTLDLNYPLYVLIPVGFLFALSLTWLYWSFAIVQWKLWAYPLVDDIVALKEQAIKANLIYSDGHFFNRTELKSAEQALRLKSIEENARQQLAEFGLQDDSKIGEATTIYYNSFSIYLGFLFGVLFVLGGLYLWYDDDVTSGKGALLKYIAIPVGVYMLYDAFKKFKRKKNPVLVFTEEGLYFYQEGEHHFLWQSLWKFDIVRRNKTDFLEIGASGGQYEIELDLSENASQLSYLYRIYQARHKKKFPDLYLYVKEDTAEDE